MLLLLDKPKGITSHDVIDRVRRITGERRVGHAGTLDPNATGLLIVGVGRESTKKLGDITKNTSKTYEATIYLGESRETDDIEGAIVSKDTSLTAPSTEAVIEALASFVGIQSQIPPQYSAIKKNGKKAYEEARKGNVVVMDPRTVEIFHAKLLSFNFPLLVVEFKVSSGTYIRSLARDLGEKLGTVAYLHDLRRTAVGEYVIKDALTLDTLKETYHRPE